MNCLRQSTADQRKKKHNIGEAKNRKYFDHRKRWLIIKQFNLFNLIDWYYWFIIVIIFFGTNFELRIYWSKSMDRSDFFIRRILLSLELEANDVDADYGWWWSISTENRFRSQIDSKRVKQNFTEIIRFSSRNFTKQFESINVDNNDDDGLCNSSQSLSLKMIECKPL